jgi:hypothetical protein
MPKNNRKSTTATRSLSFRFDVLAALDLKVALLRSERSTYVNGVFEHLLGIMAHPEYVGRNVPFVEDVNREWLPMAVALGFESPVKPSKAGGLVKRPGANRKPFA